jgi:hypothetical protein
MSSDVPTIWNALWRVAHPLDDTGRIYAFGWVNQGLACSTDWVTDPDTTLLGDHAIVFHCSTSAYSGDTADALVLRTYDAVNAAYNSSAEIIASPTDLQFYKIETSFTAIGDTGGGVFAYNLKVWVDGTLKVNSDLNTSITASTFLLRPSMGIINTAGTARTLQVDCYYQEVALSSAR